MNWRRSDRNRQSRREKWVTRLSSSFAPYYEWKIEYAKEVRKLMDDLGIRCNSTHNHIEAFVADGWRRRLILTKLWRQICGDGQPRQSRGSGRLEESRRSNDWASEKLRPAGCEPGITTTSLIGCRLKASA